MQPKRVKRPRTGWHREDIKAELRKRGWPLVRVSTEHGYARKSAQATLGHSWPKMERIIANILEVEPWEIWPHRYNDYGQPVQDGNPNMVKLSHAGRPRNVELQVVK
ncbi:helix-turn-helix domain-containing protein [Mariprofundus ferrooxydans]|uniref:Ner winged helix-turn-helix DNA-binding domain-containing protein n=2 Tax=Mariprofundus ferrooxydans TaxID=314344 RepID=Q0EWA6_9PROT|nr:helix-turn-helix domain-containing protein [Mariprofundus ferrooxydans]EAU53565.1 hypothetical protein SPV1_02968 [Mariprofundus ferrooxydans PV-1]